MKISVVTISFNQVQFIQRCLESVLNQDYKDVEYIVVDPGSTDGSIEKINKYKNIIKIFEPDEGPVDGLIKGFSMATGDIFCYLNADDSYSDNKVFSNIVNLFKLHKSIDVIYGNSYVIDSNDNQIRKIVSDKISKSFLKYGNCFISQPSTFFTKEIYKKSNGFNQNKNLFWDLELIAKFLMNDAKFLKVNSYLSNFRVHENSITSNNKFTGLKYANYFYQLIENKEMSKFNKTIYYFYYILRKFHNFESTLERIKKGPMIKY